MNAFNKALREIAARGTTVLGIVLIAFTCGLFVGGLDKLDAVATFTFVDQNPPGDIDLTPLYKAWNLLDERFVPASTTVEITDEDKLWGAIGGLARSFGDPYTVFLPPVENQIFTEEMSGSFGGAGMEIGVTEGILTVIAPLKDTPAYRAGIRAGDKILRINGESTEGFSTQDGVTRIRGEIGTKVALTLSRGEKNEIIEITLTRESITIPTIHSAFKPNGVFVISLYNFSALATSQFRMALRDFILTGSNKLIIDLRGNPGGFLEAAVDITSWFVPTGTVIVEEDFGKNGGSRVYRSKGYDLFRQNLKVVILVDQGSASASEIVAGALREHGVATLIGEKTFGKGSVQELISLTDETALKITVAQWKTPMGVSISANGLKPDIEVPLTDLDRKAGNDPQMERAMKFLIEGR